MIVELHRPVAANRIGREKVEQEIEADAAERAAVAARLQIPEVLALRCRFTLWRAVMDGRAIEAEGALRARVVRDCVVSLEPFEMDVAEDFCLRFVPEGAASDDDDDPLSIDEVAFAGGVIDLGEATVEQLALALDPFPRNPDSVLPEGEAEMAAEGALARALAARKR